MGYLLLQRPWQKIATSAFVVTIVFSQSVNAQLFRVEPAEINEFEDVEDGLQSIEDNLKDAQCGGVDLEDEVGAQLGDAGGKIVKVKGVPGREGDPLGQPELGMAKLREGDENFLYPNNQNLADPNIQTTCGFTSACRPANWPDANPRLTPPFYEPLACQRPLGGIREGNGNVEYSCGGGNENATNQNFCSTVYENGLGGVRLADNVGSSGEHTLDPITGQPLDPQAGQGGLCQKLNEDWVYVLWMRVLSDGTPAYTKGDCKTGDDAVAEFQAGNGPGTPVSINYCCTDAPIGSALKNCITCSGANCRNKDESLKADIIEEDQWFGAEPPRVPQPYFSYFRNYIAEFTREALANVNDSHVERGYDRGINDAIPVSCYGIWNPRNEFTPKTAVTQPENMRCTVPLFTQQGEVADLENDRQVMGEYQSDVEDPAVQDPARKAFNEDEDIWLEELADAFSLLNGIKLKEDYDNDLTFPLLSLDSGRQRASVQISADVPLSSSSYLRAIDDTVADINQKRSLVEWWQEQQTQAHQLLTPPVVRLILPPSWSLDLDPLQPLLTPPDPEVEAAKYSKNPLKQPIDVQLALREDLLGEVAEYLTSSLTIPIQEEKVPVVVPLASAPELRALAEAWCAWDRAQTRQADCGAGGSDIGELIGKLEEYADQIDSYRSLRAELTSVETRLLEMHNKINEHVGQWILHNGEEYLEYRESIEERMNLNTEWIALQDAWRQFHDETNMPWCKNDRYTLPIYSMLDPWLPGRPSLEGSALPRLQIERLPDLMLDFSYLNIPKEKILVPVLDPIQIKLDLQKLRPKTGEVPSLPDLPPVPSLADKLEELIPEIKVEEADAPDINPIENPVDLEQTRETFAAILKVITDMDARWATFWEGLDASELPADERKDCYGFNQDGCQYVEEELIQIFTRIAARPAVTLSDDILSSGNPLNPSVDGYEKCDPADWACMRLNPQTTKPAQGWQVEPPAQQQELIDNLRNDLFEESLRQSDKEEDEKLPFTVPPNDILPSFDIPGIIDLTPSVPPSSASSS